MKIELIYITGFMGSGKTTIGKIIAKKLKYKFIDLDVLIEKKEKRKISDIFKESGEPYFRKLEKEYLKKVSNSGGKVISLGGGALMNNENRKFVKDKGILIYLKVTPGEIYSRIKHSTDRPLLKKDDNTLCNKDEFIDRISLLFAQREPGYLSAEVIVDTVSKSPEQVASEIYLVIH
jgi:shikimate kinase